MTYTILGANGTIATELIPVLKTHDVFVKMKAQYMDAADKVIVLPKWLLKVIGYFNSFMKEAYEMNYQNEFPFHSVLQSLKRHSTLHPHIILMG